jgi:hypothetical protein
MNKNISGNDINLLINSLNSGNNRIKDVFGLGRPLPHSSVRRKAELKRREDIFRKQLLRKKQSARIKRKHKIRLDTRKRTRKCREGDYGFKERVAYYDSLERSYWYYLKRKYGISKILSLKEFEEHVKPIHIPGKDKIGRKDKTRKDFFLDNIYIYRDTKE